jgi:hypothetical protein
MRPLVRPGGHFVSTAIPAEMTDDPSLPFWHVLGCVGCPRRFRAVDLVPFRSRETRRGLGVGSRVAKSHFDSSSGLEFLRVNLRSRERTRTKNSPFCEGGGRTLIDHALSVGQDVPHNCDSQARHVLQQRAQLLVVEVFAATVLAVGVVLTEDRLQRVRATVVQPRARSRDPRE